MVCPSGWIEHAGDRFGQARPAVALGLHLAAARRRQPVVLRPLFVLRGFPLGRGPSPPLQPVQRGIERAMIDLEHVPGAGTYRDADPVAVLRPPLERPENEEIESALQQVEPLARNRRHRWEAIYHLRSEEHTSELQSQSNLVCRLLLEKKKNNTL